MSDPAPVAPKALPRLDPISLGERIALLDILRGFALYGVLLANTVWFSGRAFFTKEEFLAHQGRFDVPAGLVIRLLVDGKAMTLFSFLFGLGFAVQLGRAEAQGRNGLPVYLRRLGVLLLLGLAHVVLLWWGDILATYALTGFVLVLFRKRSTRALIFWALFLAFVPSIVGAIPAVDDLFHRALPGPADHEVFNVQMLDALRGHDRWLLTWMHLKKALYHPMSMPLSFLAWPLSRFLAGYAVGRSRVLEDVAARRSLFRKLLVGGLVVAVTCAVVFFVRRGFVRGGGTLPPWARVALQVPAFLLLSNKRLTWQKPPQQFL